MQADLSAPHTTLVDQAWSVRMADSAMARYPLDQAKWHYEHGLLLKSLEPVWRVTGAVKYWHFIHDTIDLFVDVDGSLRTYQLEEYNLDQINPGKSLFTLWHSTGDRRYATALHTVASSVGAAAAHSVGRLLAQADLSVSNVARRHLHGRAVLRRVCADV